MSGPQLEHGYTRIANEILESIAKVKLSPTQYRIIFIVWRYTYGFQRKEHGLSLTFLSEATGCDLRLIQRELKRLIDLNILQSNQNPGKTRNVSFNKNIKQWDIANGVLDNGKTTNGEIDNSLKDQETNGVLDNGTNGVLDNQERKKENIKENSVYDDFVKEILLLYPGVKSKSVRDKKLPNIIKKYGEEKVITCVKNYADIVKGTDKKYILHESTFWNTRYMDFMVKEENTETRRGPLKLVIRDSY